MTSDSSSWFSGVLSATDRDNGVLEKLVANGEDDNDADADVFTLSFKYMDMNCCTNKSCFRVFMPVKST